MTAAEFERPRLSELAEQIADAIEAEALGMRNRDFRSGRVGIEYINGFEDAARIAREHGAVYREGS